MDKLKTLWSIWGPSIVKEVESILQTFAAGMATFILVNWSTLSTLKWGKDVLISVGLSVLRAGLKALWAFLKPQIISGLTWLASKGN